MLERDGFTSSIVADTKTTPMLPIVYDSINENI